MARFNNLMTWLILSGLFVLALINFGLLFQSQNINAISPQSYFINYSGFVTLNNTLQENLSSSVSNIEASGFSAENSSITTGSLGNPFFNAVGGIWKVIKVAPTAIYNLLAGFLTNTLLAGGSGLIVLYSISSIMVLTIIGAVVYLITRGEP